MIAVSEKDLSKQNINTVRIRDYWKNLLHSFSKSAGYWINSTKICLQINNNLKMFLFEWNIQ